MDRVDRIIAQWNRERPELDVGPMALLGRMNRLYACLRQGIEANFASHGLTAANFDILATLRRSGAPYQLTPGGLLAATMVTSGTITARLDQLEAMGFVERRANPEDGRGALVRLTDKGFAVIEAAVATHVATQHRLLAALDEPTRAVLDATLRRWLAAFEPPEVS